MKQSEKNKILVNSYKGPSDKAKCFFTEEEFDLEPGKAAYSYNGNPVHPRWARSKGFEISSDLELPDGINSRTKLSTFLTDNLELDRNSKEFSLLYKTFGENLPVGYPTDGQY